MPFQRRDWGRSATCRASGRAHVSRLRWTTDTRELRGAVVYARALRCRHVGYAMFFAIVERCRRQVWRMYLRPSNRDGLRGSVGPWRRYCNAESFRTGRREVAARPFPVEILVISSPHV
jgi:hypothetical protein